jgi:hypothetical protein
MWNLFNCYLSGRHEFGVWCEPGTVFLRCVHCGKRSSGWTLEAKAVTPPPVVEKKRMARARVVPFDRAAAS